MAKIRLSVNGKDLIVEKNPLTHAIGKVTNITGDEITDSTIIAQVHELAKGNHQPDWLAYLDQKLA